MCANALARSAMGSTQARKRLFLISISKCTGCDRVKNMVNIVAGGVVVPAEPEVKYLHGYRKYQFVKYEIMRFKLILMKHAKIVADLHGVSYNVFL